MVENIALARRPVVAADAEAGQHALQTLLNCYCREIAFPEEQIGFGSPFGQNDWPLALRAARGGGQVMHVVLPHTNTRLIAVTDRLLPAGRLRLRSSLYGRTPGQAWTPLGWQELATLLLRELSRRHGAPFNEELLAQIRDSVETVTAILTDRVRPAPSADALTQYAESEQALVLGHPFHPAPKSRHGFDAEDRRRYSPELCSRFPLHWFAVRRDLLQQRTLLADMPDAIIAAHAPISAEPDHAPVPVHPWQARHVLTLPAVRRAIAEGAIHDLGPMGEAYVPTSSIRTLFHPANPFFLKLSLHVRITNCLRKNAFYELDGAVEVTRLIRERKSELAALFPDLRVLEEPAFLTVDPTMADPDERTAVVEAFGLILREGVQGLAGEGVTPLLAAALFGDAETGVPRARDLCRTIARREHMPYATAAEAWFTAYAGRLVPPVLHALFARGIVFEPHLQNTLVAVRDGWPVRIVLRDFEGVKLVDGCFESTSTAHLDLRARQALWYDEERGWNRIAYCLFVNQLGEAVDHLAEGDAALAARLWRIVHDDTERYQAHHGSSASRMRLGNLLAGASLPAKANLLVRFSKQADRFAGYAPLANPLMETSSWS